MASTPEVITISADISIGPMQLKGMSDIADGEMEEMLAYLRLGAEIERFTKNVRGADLAAILGSLPSYTRTLEQEMIVTAAAGEALSDKQFEIEIKPETIISHPSKVAIFGIVRYTRDVIVAGEQAGPEPIAYAARIQSRGLHQPTKITVAKGVEASPNMAARIVIDKYKSRFAGS